MWSMLLIEAATCRAPLVCSWAAVRDLLSRLDHLLEFVDDLGEGLVERGREADAAVDALRALLGGENGGVGRGLNLADDALDVPGGARAFDGELANLLGDHREPLAVLARPGGLDGRVEREQIGLLGDVADGLDDGADLLGLARELQDLLGDPAHALLDDVHALDREPNVLPAVLGGLHRVLGGTKDKLDHLGGLPGGDRDLVDGGGGLVNQLRLPAEVRLPIDDRRGERRRVLEDAGRAIAQLGDQQTVAGDEQPRSAGPTRTAGSRGRRPPRPDPGSDGVELEELPQLVDLLPRHRREGLGAAALALLARLEVVQPLHDEPERRHGAGAGGVLRRRQLARALTVGDIRERDLQPLEEALGAHLIGAAARVGGAQGRGRARPMSARRPAKSPPITGGGRGGCEVPGGERPGLCGGALQPQRPVTATAAHEDRRRGETDEEQDPALLPGALADAPETRGLFAGEFLVNGLRGRRSSAARAPRATRTARPGTAASRRRPAARRPRSWRPPRAAAAR